MCYVMIIVMYVVYSFYVLFCSFLRSPDNSVIDKKHEEVYQVCFNIIRNYSMYTYIAAYS